MKERKAIKEKKKQVEQIKKFVLEYPMFGIINMENLPTFQLQKMKYKMQNVQLMVVKKRLIKRAFEELKDQKKDLNIVIEKLRGMPALIFSKEDPFKLFKTLKASKSFAPMKAGQVAPNNIVVHAGPTEFAPGPIIGELGRVGLKTGVENGKIVIKEDKVIAKEGDVVDDAKADILAKMKIEPMEIGLNLILTYQDGEILTKDVLDVDEEVYISNIKLAALNAHLLSVGVAYPTSENIGILLSKATVQADHIADKFGILTKDNVGKSLAKAEGEMMILKSKLPNLEVADEAKVEEPKEEEKVEEQSTEKEVEESKEEEKVEEQSTEDVADKQFNQLEVADNEVDEKSPEEQQEDEKPLEEEDGVFKDKEKQAQDFLKQATDQIIKKS